MKVYKFGGASVKDAAAVKNVATIIEREPQDQMLWVVVSAMGKTTNALESILEAHVQELDNREQLIEQLKDYHEEIMRELFPFSEHPVWTEVNQIFTRLKATLATLADRPAAANYAAVVSCGEMLSTRIISAYLDDTGADNAWVDARQVIRTDLRYKEAKVDMEASRDALLKLQDHIADSRHGLGSSRTKICITQGFIGGSGKETTTLGREGSDYTGGIIAWALDARELSIWKDVPGMLNADPKYYAKAERFEKLSYREAIELSYYGASVIHPKTIKPLQNKHIPLYVRSFIDPSAPGTVIQLDEGQDTSKTSFIFKQPQVLLSIIPKDFSFIMEENISHIFGLLAERGIKADLIQSSALSFSICMQDTGVPVDELREALGQHYKVLYNQGLSLLTVRHYDEPTLDELLQGRDILVEQRSRQTARFVLRGGFSPIAK